MYSKTKELTRRLLAELEYVAMPALLDDAIEVYGREDGASDEYEAAKDLYKQLKAFYFLMRRH